MGVITTFYSYKGGVGRTMAVANIAVLLAKKGKNVLLVDWDLEAPGLHKYFKDYKETHAKIKKGLLGLLEAASTEAKKPHWANYTGKIELSEKHKLDVLWSGCEDMENYVTGILNFDWNKFYSEKGGGQFIEELRDQWKDEYDHVFIDSRTGVTDYGGICTIQLPDFLTLVFTPNMQSIEGVKDYAIKAQKARQRLAYDRMPLLIFPLLSRFDGKEEKQRGESWLKTASEEMALFYIDWLPKDFPILKVLENTKLPYIPYFSFGEELAVEKTSLTATDTLGYAYNRIANIFANHFRDVIRDVSLEKTENEDVVKLTKEYISDDKYRIKLEDLITQEIRKVLDLTSKDNMPLSVSNLTADEVSNRLSKYEEILKPLCDIIIVLCYWGRAEQVPLIRKIILRIAETNTTQSGLAALISLRWYPLCLLLYTGGIASIASGKYGNLASLLTSEVPDPEYIGKTKSVVIPMSNAMEDIGNLFKQIPGHEKNIVPRSEYMFKILRPFLEDIIFTGNSYEDLFDRYELFQMFVYADLLNCEFGPWGRFAWKHVQVRSSLVKDFIEEAQKEGDEWPPIQAGLFKQDIKRFNEMSKILLPGLKRSSFF